MRSLSNKFLLSLIMLLFVLKVQGTNYTWTGVTSTAWNTTTNWSPNGLPDSLDNVTIATATTNSPVLSQNRKVNNLTVTTDSINLGTYTLTFKATGTFTAGVVYNGTIQARGTGLAAFNGTKIDCIADIICGYIRLSGSTFQQDAYFEDSGVATGLGAGGCTFNGNVTIKHTGTNTYFTLANTTGDNFNGNLILINTSTHEINIATSDSSTFNGNIEVNSTSTGGIMFGLSGGKSVLASGKTISVGSTGFTNDYLTLKKFTQLGSTAQTLSLTGSGAVNIIDGVFNGGLTVSASGYLLKNNSFFGTSSFTKNGTPNYQSDGGNTFFGATTISNSGSAGRIRMATVTADNYKNNATFNSTGQDLQVAYSGDNYFEGNITINSIKVVFNTATGRVLFTGTNSQSLNGSYNYAFKKVTLNKNSNHVIANTTFSVDDSLTFIKGNFLTTSTNLLTMKAGSKALNANNASFVSGPVKKVGNTSFIFPVGKFSNLKPIGISAPTSISSAFTSEFIEDSILVNNGQRDSTLGYLYRDQFYKLNRNVGTDNVFVTIQWDNLTGIVDTFVAVTSWNGTMWKDLGRGNFVGNITNGSVTSSITANSYNEFTIGYTRTGNPATNINCGNIQDAITLQSCLINAAYSDILVITSGFAINEPTINLPLPIGEGVTLIGNSSTNLNLGWWTSDSPLLFSDYKHSYYDANCACTNNVPANCTTQCAPEELFLFKMQSGSTIQNIRIRGANCNYQDYNDDDNLCGGIYILNDASGFEVQINNCELSCFSYAGIFKEDLNRSVSINNSYIHKVKGRSSLGIGYGTWIKGDISPNPLAPHNVTFTNTLFDDCKAAIDGQGDPINWIINGCTFSQFFLSEDINKHNDNRFKMWSTNNPLDYFFCYTNSLNNCLGACFYGPICNVSLPCTTETTFVANPGYTTNWITCTTTSDIPVYDVGGGDTRITNSIFHKKWDIDKNGNINLPMPNWDESNNRFGNEDFEIEISNCTFATELFVPAQVAAFPYKNNAGYSKIADNYIEACVYSGESRFIKYNNSFGYSDGIPVEPSSSQPFELSLGLKAFGNNLEKSYTSSPNKNQEYIQFIEINTAFNIEHEIVNPVSGSLPFYITRPNTNDGTGIDENISSQNCFYDDEVITSSTSNSITYTQPGLYGIDVIGFDTQDHGLGEMKFKASSWQHIPIIVKDDTEEQMLYFNIKDSYLSNTATTVSKVATLNNTIIWKEDIAEGGTGWEYVKVDLDNFVLGSTSQTIKSLINTDGSPNYISFGIYIDIINDIYNCG